MAVAYRNSFPLFADRRLPLNAPANPNSPAVCHEMRLGTAKNTNGKPLGFKTIIKPSTKAIRKHVRSLRQTIDNHRGTTQAQLVSALNRTIDGWARYYSTVVSAMAFGKLTD